MRPNDPVEIGVLISPTWIPGLERAVELLRTRNQGMSDGEILERIVVEGLCSIVNKYTPRNESPFGQDGQTVAAVLR